MARQRKLPSALRAAGLVLAWFVMLSVGATLLVALVVPRLAGATPYVIETGSMTPSLPPGTLIVVKPVPVAELAAGDVITYQISSGDPTVVTHRIIEQGVDMTGQPRWRTQGDANDVADEGFVLPVQVQGKQWYAVPYLGYVTSFVTGQQRQVLTVAFVLGLTGYAAAMFLGSWRGRQAGRPTPDATATENELLETRA
ncbi:signal peptidase I [Nocardioides sp. cx-169]|uniref:signal peptidase I n=1 Tax=Nocardioides sp. cx-169 TaxID=2899080 RepID=UPI001E62B2A5|nr:signal peptidase I [Nocardioides sp. cx-169]MCD4535089.1 signal peptidase I [Nocardioides sp. cx-169]